MSCTKTELLPYLGIEGAAVVLVEGCIQEEPLWQVRVGQEVAVGEQEDNCYEKRMHSPAVMAPYPQLKDWM